MITDLNAAPDNGMRAGTARFTPSSWPVGVAVGELRGKANNLPRWSNSTLQPPLVKGIGKPVKMGSNARAV